MIKRDNLGFIVQHSKEDPTYADGGDTAMRTGVMAVCGSQQDGSNLPFFMQPTSKLLMRHPAQPPWNNPSNFTRDQLIAWAAGSKTWNQTDNVLTVRNACIKRGFRAQNTEYDYPGTSKVFPNGADLLSPADMLFIAYCANSNPLILLLFSIAGIPWFLLSLLVATKMNPEGEQNQIICQCLTYGRLTTRIYVKLMPNYKNSLYNYWGGWRDQAEIADMLINRIEEVWYE